MPLSTGDRLGPYEILAPIGAGGMGEVYRARDTRVKRDVAVKMLPPAYLHDPERVGRFQREAEVLASLDHPNIGPLYGLVDSADSRGLVLALVEGSTLANRINAGRLPQDEALGIAKQIIEALEYAHERGVVHRDLKPANVKITPEGVVKVLDFGLAKVLEDEPPPSRLADSPTLTVGHTRVGVILGTAAYMSPEQALGRRVDRRSDIFSFGAVLYEMFTGKRAFTGANTADVLEAVVKKDPDWSMLPEDTPRVIEKLLHRCLSKDRKQRLQAIGEARIILERPEDDEMFPAAAATASPGSFRRKLWPITAAVLALTTVFALWNRSTVVQRTAARLTIPLPPGQEITSSPAITRDGTTVAYIARQWTDDAQLYLRHLNSFEAQAVAGSSGARQPFFSPDGKWVAFFARGQLQKAHVSGGAPIRLAEAPGPFGGTWNEDNTIIYVPSFGSGLFRIPASGGTPESLTKTGGTANGNAHVFPQALSGGRSVLLTVWGQTPGNAVFSLDSRGGVSGQWEVVLPTGFAGIFDSAGGLMGRILVGDPTADIRAARFDAVHPTRTNADNSVLSNVYYDVEGEYRGWLSVSNNGTAVYAPGNPAKKSLAWVDREGRIETLGEDQDVYRELSLSPDGTKAAVRHSFDVWIHNLQRGTASRLSREDTIISLLWTRDGTQIIFGSNRGGDFDIYSQPADGSQPAGALLKRPYDQYPLSILTDGALLYREIHPKTGSDLWILLPDGKTSPLRVTPFNETDGQFSPVLTGGTRWVAYSSDESGRSEIFVQPYPLGTNRIAVSTGGGSLPRWSRDGKELFYLTGEAVVAVGIRPDGSLGVPRRLFDRPKYFLGLSSYDVSPDGKRFLMIQRNLGSVPDRLNVILNWSDELDRAAAARNR
jgi:Tol biopolymer transport system component